MTPYTPGNKGFGEAIEKSVVGKGCRSTSELSTEGKGSSVRPELFGPRERRLSLVVTQVPLEMRNQARNERIHSSASWRDGLRNPFKTADTRLDFSNRRVAQTLGVCDRGVNCACGAQTYKLGSAPARGYPLVGGVGAWSNASSRLGSLRISAISVSC